MLGTKDNQLLTLSILQGSIHSQRDSELIVRLKSHHAFQPRYQIASFRKELDARLLREGSYTRVSFFIVNTNIFFIIKSRIEIRHPCCISPEMEMPAF